MITKLYINGSECDIDSGQVMTLTATSFDLFNLGVRTSSFSNVFKLPKTQNNRLIFKSAGVINSTNNEPYQKLEAQVFVDGASVVFGVAELVEVDGDYFSVSIKANSGNLYTELKSLKFTDLAEYLNELNHDYNANEVSDRRDSASGIVYPNVDYGFMRRALSGDQPYNYFYPALYLSYILNSAFDLLGYIRRGNFWTSDLYNSLAILAKDIVPEGALYNVEYKIKSGFGLFVSRVTETSGQNFTNKTPLNYTDEVQDASGLYQNTDLGTGYVTLAYNFNEVFTDDDILLADIPSKIKIENTVQQSLIDAKIENLRAEIRISVYNKTTDTFLEQVYSRGGVLFFASFVNGVYVNGSAELRTELDFQSLNAQLEFDAIVGPNATDYCLLFELCLISTTAAGETVSSLDLFSNVSVEGSFNIIQQKQADFDVSVLNSFPDINIGQAFLYLCNLGGLIPNVDENTKSIELVTFDELRKNKSNALDWSDKIDLSTEPVVSFRMQGFAKRNLLQYSNDTNDVYLNELDEYGQGVLTVDNENLEEERTKYAAPYSLVDIGPVFIDDSPRFMGRVFTGNKYTFNGVEYVLDINAPIETFTDRMVYLSRSENFLIQISGGNTVEANYDLVNGPIFFDGAIADNYSLITEMLEKSKVVKAAFRLTTADIAQFDFGKPVYIDFFNDYFYVNEISQFKLNQTDSTEVTLIRL